MGQLDEQRHKEGWDMTVEIGGIAALVRLGFTEPADDQNTHFLNINSPLPS